MVDFSLLNMFDGKKGGKDEKKSSKPISQPKQTQVVQKQANIQKPVVQQKPVQNKVNKGQAVKTPLINFKNVYKKLDKKLILKNINIQIYPGEIFGVIGVSGAGKTTLLRCMIGFYKINQGMIQFQDKDISNEELKIRRIFGFATQDNCFYEKLTVWENLMYFGKLYSISKKTREITAKNLLRLVELEGIEKLKASSLSGGMKRRLDLACSLMHGPKILILDEPGAGLDPSLRRHMWELIAKINKSGTTIVLSSHLLSEIEHLCTRVGIINKGEMLKIGTPDFLKGLYSKDAEIHLETFPGKYDVIASNLKNMNLPINYISNHGHKMVIYTPRAEQVMHATLHLLEQMNERLLDVDVDKPTLSEVFEALTEKQRIKGLDEDKLSEYIKASLAKGYKKDQIREILLKQKWPEEIINSAMIKLS